MGSLLVWMVEQKGALVVDSDVFQGWYLILDGGVEVGGRCKTQDRVMVCGYLGTCHAVSIILQGGL